MGKEEVKEAPPVEVDEAAVEQTYKIEPACPVPKAKKPRPAPPGAWVQDTADILGPDSQHAYVQKWMKMREDEKKGLVKFRVVRNDSSEESLVLLLGLKNVFVKQLPNMPKYYVTRLVFDKKHESVVLLKKDENTGEDVVMGGCCYRPFIEQRFGEIAFLAISHQEQVRGYGTRLMARTKEEAKSKKLDVLLTCADNHAVNYFKKQGFSKKISLPAARWMGYIKDYEGVTLMECKLHMKVNYLELPPIIKAQKMCLIEKMKEVSNSHIVHPGLDAKKRQGIPVDSIPGYKEVYNLSDANGGNLRVQMPSIANRDPAHQKELTRQLQGVLELLKDHRASYPFAEPVDVKETGAYDYYQVIKNPIDLQTIQKRLDLGWYYITKDIFIADVMRMIENCYSYNGNKHEISDLARQLEKFFQKEIANLTIA
mmetsp:Transcript_13202/g.40588  ORF Transcript_13202/g.40588 Transcript_13202/m.40588 type:complete len:426 (+) Transcript_13202:54-1331(+)